MYGMSGGGFRQAGLPAALADEVVEFIEENPWLGYKSLSAFVTAGSRKLLQEVRREVYQKMLLESGYDPPSEADNGIRLRSKR